MTNTQPITKAELAEFLRVSERTVDRLMARDSIPYIKAGGAVRFDLASVLDALKVDAAKGGE